MIGQTISHYKILEKLGEGGMGVVYKAEDTKLARVVALKFLPSTLTQDTHAKERFIHEAKAASALSHPNICSIHTIEEWGDEEFLDMEFVEGKTLGAVLKERELPLKGVLDIAVQIGEGLNAAHKKGIVHRDIKPENIMLATDGGTVKIMDFGLAKLKGATKLTKAGSTLGTAAYMSPEQARGEDVDARTDIFSFGAILYEMITGHRPFMGEHEAAIVYSLMNETPEPLARYKADVPFELQRIVDKALAKERDQRYQHIDEMAADLRRMREETQDQTRSSAKKSKLPWIAAIAVIVCAAIGMYLFIPKSIPISETGKSVAVLPFENLSDSKEDEYFSDGITDDIIAQLSKIADLKVISRTSVMQYKGVSKNVRDIGRELDVATVLEGSVRRSGNQIRIVAQLIDARNEGHLWADTYDEAMTQVFAIQSDVAQRIAGALQAKLSPAVRGRIERKQTENTEAYQLYLKGRYLWNKRTLPEILKANDCFTEAVEKDPNYAMAFAGIASASVIIPQYGVSQIDEWYTRARNAAMKALALDSTLAEAHTVLGEIAEDHYYGWTDAEKHFRKAIDLDPGYPTAHQWYSCLLTYLSRFDEALPEAKRALELDPLSLVIIMNLGDTYYAMREYDNATEQYHNLLALDQTFPWGYSGMANVDEAEGRFSEALAGYRKSEALGGGTFVLPYIGGLYARMGKKAEALRVIDTLRQLAAQGIPVSYGVGYAYYRLGERDKAFEWLERSYHQHETWLVVLGYDPIWDDLRSDPRFIALLRKTGLRK